MINPASQAPGFSHEEDASKTLSDTAARDTIAKRVDCVLFVEAGAGTGKTDSLVSRVLTVASQMRSGIARNGRSSYIVAITFTEAAARELSQRIEEKLSGAEPLVVATTIHSFAARILRSYGTFSTLPIGFQSLDDIAETAYLAETWSAAIKRLMDGKRSGELLGHYYSLGASSSGLRKIYERLHDNWDRLLLPAYQNGYLVEVTKGIQDALEHGSEQGSLRELVAPMVVELLGSFDALQGGVACTDQDDRLYRYIQESLLPLRDELRRYFARDDIDDDIDGVLETLSSALGGSRETDWGFKKSVSKVGKNASWQEIDNVREQCDGIRKQAESIVERAGSYVADELTYMISGLVLEDAGKRVMQGRVTFHDLLVLARNLLRDNVDVRKRVREEYPYIFVDEFQDTDPLQAEIVGYIVSKDDTCDFSNVRPGSLFVVGDPRQSIYRFRRADVHLYRSLLHNATSGVAAGGSLSGLGNARESGVEGDSAFDATFINGADGGDPVDHRVDGPVGHRAGGTAAIGERVILKTNFRSVPQIIDLVNKLFVDIFDDNELSGDALLAGRAGQHSESRAISDDAGSKLLPSHVYSIGDALAKGDTGGNNIDEVRRLSARDMAGSIRLMVEQQWPVYSRNGEVKPIRFRDIAILLPRRTSVESIEKEFIESGIPYHLEGTGSAWNSDEVFDILSVLRAVADPYDPLAVVSALRSPLVGCSDEDIYLWHASGRKWSLFDEQCNVAEKEKELYDDTTGGEDFVAHIEEGMGILRRLVDMSMGESISALIRYILFDLGMLAAYTGSRHSRESVALLRWLLSKAVDFDDTSRGHLVDFIHFVDNQALLEDRSALKIPQDDDDDVVRIMTVHGAKGLEFPAVFVAGIDGDSTNTIRPSVLFDSSGQVSIKAGRVKSKGFDDLAAIDAQADIDESKRLLYVACTRARDYLIFMVHHKEGSSKDTCYAALLYEWFNTHPEFKFDFPVVGEREQALDGAMHIGGAGDMSGADHVDGVTHAGGVTGVPAGEATGILAGQIRKFIMKKQRLSEMMRNNSRYIIKPTAIQEWLARGRYTQGASGVPPARVKGVARSREDRQVLGTAVHKVLEQLDLREVLLAMRGHSEMNDARHKGVMPGTYFSNVETHLSEMNDAIHRGEYRDGRDVLDYMVQRIARSYHIEEMAGEMRRMVVNALGSSTVNLAATYRYRQELPVATSLDNFFAALMGTVHPASLPYVDDPVDSIEPHGHTLGTPYRPGIGSPGAVQGITQGVVQGTIDLLIESDDGLIVVDFKTEGLIDKPNVVSVTPEASKALDASGKLLNEVSDQLLNGTSGELLGEDRLGDGSNEHGMSNEHERDSHLYQLACYAGMVESVTKKSVSKCVIVYLGGDKAVERFIEGNDLRETMQYVGRRLDGM